MNIGIISQNREINIMGINKVTLGMLTELLKLDNSNNYYFIGKSDWLNLPVESIPALPDTEGTMKLNYTLKAYPLDVIHSHYRAFEFNDNFKCGKILTIHDLIPLVFPEWFRSQYAYYDETLKKCARESDVVITVSEATKKDVIDYYGINEDKVRVVYNGLYPTNMFGGMKYGKPIDDLENVKFLLSVNGIAPNKNQLGLVEAFSVYIHNNPDSDVKLVLTGPVRQYQVVRDIMKKCDCAEERLVFTGFVSDEQLLWLYQNAIAFIYVSFYEGFGLPILEALSLGKAVICSDVSSMPEVGGDAVQYCNPHDTESVSEAICKVVSDDEYRHILEKKAIDQAGKFSYEKAAYETLDIYRIFER